MSNSKKSLSYYAFIHGLCLGLVLSWYDLVQYLTDNELSQGMSIFSAVILLIGLLCCQIYFRKHQMDGYCSFGKSLAYGIIVVLISSIFIAIFLFLLLQCFGNTMLDHMQREAEESILKYGRSAEAAAIQKELIPVFFSTFSIAFFTFLGNIIIGIPASFITSAISYKSHPDPISILMKERARKEKLSGLPIEESNVTEEVTFVAEEK